jgi:polar amino acid transport system substrate-binding protein
VLAQFVSLIKETSVAGFITVLELTRAGDLIRSITMQAFLPLLSVALIYFVLTRILLTLVKMLNQKLDKKRSARLVKGVD